LPPSYELSTCLVADRGLLNIPWYLLSSLRVVHPVALGTLFTVLPTGSPTLQLHMLNSVLQVLRGSGGLLSTSACAQSTPPMLELMLGLVTQLPNVAHHVAAVMQELGTFTVSVREVKTVFRLLRCEGVKPWSVMSVLRHTVEVPTGPSRYFVMDGVGSGLRAIHLLVRGIMRVSRWGL
jgi:hypothetical protein